MAKGKIKSTYNGTEGDKYANLRELLGRETYPYLFTFKFIGKNTASFDEGVEEFQADFLELTLGNRRMTPNEKHVALTFQLMANSVEEIIDVYKGISKLPDLELIL